MKLPGVFNFSSSFLLINGIKVIEEQTLIKFLGDTVHVRIIPSDNSTA
jgi:hypothetical protein